jgi:hypothetical protein
MATDPIKGVILEAVQKTLGHRETLNEIENALDGLFNKPASCSVEMQDLSASETVLIVRTGGPSRHFVVKVKESL